MHDLRYGFRQLRLNPGFAVVSMLSLALGIGANTAIFQLVDALRLRSLPVKSPEELVEIRIGNWRGSSGNFSGRRIILTNPLWEQIRDRQEAFRHVAAWGDRRFNLAPGGEARYAEGLFVSGDFFHMLGVPPVLGRVFTPVDDRRGCGAAGAVISYGFWQREFGGQASAIGRNVTLDGHPFEVIGVTAASFFGVEVGRSFDVAIPLCAEPVVYGENSALDRRHYWWLAAMGRPKPGWPLEKVTAQLESISPAAFEATVHPGWRAEIVKSHLGYKLKAYPAASGVSRLREDYERPLWLLMATTGLVLLIACANLANLLLARASVRAREIAVRLAIGASRARLVRQLLSESLTLALTGAALGVVLAKVLSRFLLAFVTTGQNPLFLDLSTDWRVLGFTCALAVLTCVLFGLAPALRATRGAPMPAMKGGGRGMTVDRERSGLRRLLVVSQVALSLVLLVGSLLFVRSLRNLITLDAGFRQEGPVVASLDLRRLNYPVERRRILYRQILERLRATPGVESAAQAGIVPMSGAVWNDSIVLDGETADRLSNFTRVSAAYFKTMGTPILTGRDFDARDTLSSTRVALVNEAFRKRFLGGASPAGRTFRIQVGPGEASPVHQIIGLVKDMKYRNLREDFPPTVFVLHSQEAKPGPYASFVLRSNSSLSNLLASVRRAIGEVSPDISMQFRSMPTMVRESLTRERLMATLSGFFGLLAGVLATLGLYGVMSYMVVRRQTEIGIRMALGADRFKISRMILRESSLLLGIGLAIGTALAVWAGTALAAFMFGLKPNDPATIASAIALLAGVAFAASVLPAHRASSLDPIRALREE
ncbi:MAG: ABC transporter permease [Bryobacteraceae bacterium]